MRITFILVALLAAAATAGATYHLDERFEGRFPPPGWRVAHAGDGGWHQSSGPGPYYHYATGNAGVPLPLASGSRASAWAELMSPTFGLPAATIIYYRFSYCTDQTTRGDAMMFAEFYMVYPDTGERLVDLIYDHVEYPWKEATGSVVVAKKRPFIAVWRVEYDISVPGYFMFNVDNAQLSDENVVDVTPASFGRVKALFR